MNDRGILSCVFITMLCINMSFSLGIEVAKIGNEWTGPWVDKVTNKVIPDESERLLALIEGEVDIIGGKISPSFIDMISFGDPVDIEVEMTYQMGYGITEINCAKYPMNLTNFRRAIAFAIDKHRIIEEGWLGMAQLIDCHIPTQHPASIDDDMDYHYYDKQLETGIELLTQTGFIDSDDDGWLEGPGPEGPGTIELETIIMEGHQTAQVEVFVDSVVEALLDLGIYAESRLSSILDYDPHHRIFRHGDYDLLFHEKTWSDLDLDYYARDMSTDYMDVPYYNLPNWSNESWDALVPTVLYSTDYDEILEIAKQMEHIWVHSCPAIVMYQSLYFTAFREDRFEGVTPTILDGAPNFFTNLRVKQKDADSVGGTYVWANPRDILSFNHFSVNSPYADNILNMLFDSLVRIDPEGNDILWMCESFSIETHGDNSTIPDNHTRITVDVAQNTTWSDGTPITAEDFAFSLNFMLDCVPHVGMYLVDMINCYSVGNSKLICEFDTVSFWHWHHIAYCSVIPKQIWREYSDAYDEYQPNPDTIGEMVLSDPFLPITWKQGEYAELVQNPFYFRNPRHLANWTTTNAYSTDNESSQTSSELLISNFSLMTVGLIYGFVFVVLAVDYIRAKRKEVGLH